MKISVINVENDKLIHAINKIANLYFEEVEMIKGPSLEASATITIAIETTNLLQVHVKLETNDHQVFEASLEKIPTKTVEKEIYLEQKNLVLRCLITCLTDWTGITQKWGILTGIRPTKLLHKQRKLNISKEESKKHLKDTYLISEEKLDLMQEIVDRQLKVIPDLYELKQEVSLYIGIPFCPTKCAYCTFPAYAIGAHKNSVEAYLDALHEEIRAIGKFLTEKNIQVTTIYFGGGTPTAITAEQMDDLYSLVYQSFPLAKLREVTVEAGRPDTISEDKINVLKKFNIDRISINPQSYTQNTLKAIGRHHTVKETIDKYGLAKEMGMNNINMDLIIGLPNEGVEELRVSLEETSKLMPESLTVHTLSFKRASEMSQNKDKYKVASRNEVNEMMNMAVDWTKENGYYPYYLYRQKNILGNLENVGYSVDGQESIYNIMIMEEEQSIIGLGCGATSKFMSEKNETITPFSNPKDLITYNQSYQKYIVDKLELLKKYFD